MIDRIRCVMALILVGLVVAGCSGPGSGGDDPAPTASRSEPAVQSTSTPPAPTTTATPVPTPTPTPMPTPTPTPTPTPPPLAECYRPRPASAGVSAPATPADAAPGTPEASPPAGEAATPEATPSGPEFVLRPADPTSVFQSCQVIAYYGYPDIPVMGILGSGEPDAVVHQLLAQAAEYDAVNGDRGVAPALHLIYAVAQGSPTDDGTYLYRMPDELVRRYIDAAERLNILLILDIQMGHSTVDAELPHVLPYLENPRVHLALDPEFAMPNGEVPGTIIGTLDASEINKAQHALRKVVEEHRLPNKILVVHQFRHEMISNKQAIEDVPNVDLVIDMDGFGGQFPKTDGYRMFVNEDGAEHGGFKLFYDQDVDLLTPEQVSHLDPQPDLVIYQ